MVAEEKEATTSSLILDSLEIRGFRGFRHLQIERLGRVNLIVGKNGVGKTALLEALWLYANRGHPLTIWEEIETRDEGNRPGINDEAEDTISRISALRFLFYDCADIFNGPVPITIGPIDTQSHILKISIELSSERSYPLVLYIAFGKEGRSYYPDETHFQYTPFKRLWQEKPEGIFVRLNGLSRGQISRLWDEISLTDLEDDVLKALRIIIPEVERVNLVSSQKTGNANERIPIAKITHVEYPSPLRSLGEGMNRLFGIAMALVNAKGGMLLIDEVESGLHYSVQPDVWKLIFETAARLNVQVFATTHSWDCIEAFQKAATKSDEEGLMIRLAEKKGEIIADVFAEKELEIATRENIELR